jgi:hypothetical protein
MFCETGFAPESPEVTHGTHDGRHAAPFFLPEINCFFAGSLLLLRKTEPIGFN